jgi:hypothetical protein
MQAPLAVAVVDTRLALEACLGADILSESGSTDDSHAEDSQRAARGRLEHTPTIGLLSNVPSQIVEAIGVHTFLLK